MCWEEVRLNLRKVTEAAEVPTDTLSKLCPASHASYLNQRICSKIETRIAEQQLNPVGNVDGESGGGLGPQKPFDEANFGDYRQEWDWEQKRPQEAFEFEDEPCSST